MLVDKLNQLAELYSQRDLLGMEKQRLIDAILTPEIKAQIAEIEAEFSGPVQAVNDKAASLENEIRADVVTAGATVKGEYLQAVFTKGRVSWDTKALDGYAAAHPEITTFRKVGEPSVSIRKL